MPSSGKTTLGKKLASALRFDFIDLDAEIVKQEKQSITEIFAQKGENYFRETERKVLEKTLPQKNTIIATGGGTPCFFENRNFIKQHGISVFINIDLSVLTERILTSDERPLWNKKTVQEVKNDLEITFKKRLPFYQEADISMDSEMNFETLLLRLLDY